MNLTFNLCTLSSLEQILLSLFILAILGSLLFLFYKLIVKECKLLHKDKFSVLDDVASYDDLVHLIDYRLRQDGACFSLAAIAIDRLDKAAEYIHEVGVETYFSKVEAALRMNLPRGGKMAKTPEKDMFLIYIPEVLNDEQLFDAVYKLKQAAERRHIISGDIFVRRTATAAAIRSEDREISEKKDEEQNNLTQNLKTLPKLLIKRFDQISSETQSLIDNLKAALFHGLRNGGNTVVLYDSQLPVNKENLDNYLHFKRLLDNKEIRIRFMPIFDSVSQKCYGLKATAMIKNENKKLDYDEILRSAVESGDAFWLCQRLFESMIEEGKNIYDVIKDKEFYILIPISTLFLENSDAGSLIDALIKKVNLDPSKVVLYLRELSIPTAEGNIVRNLINLKNNGYKFCRLSSENLSDSIIKANDFDFCLVDFLQQEEFALIESATLIALNVRNLIEMNEISQKGISFMLGPYFGLPLTGDELLPFITKNRL